MSVPEIAVRAQLACLLEAAAAKPGNVGPAARFGDVGFEHYLASAAAIGPVMASADERGVGALVLDGVRACRRYVPANTNLGILLLLAPLARATARVGAGAGGAEPANAGSPAVGSAAGATTAVGSAAALRDSLRHVLADLTLEDSRLAYAAIRESEPGGLGTAPEQDVRDEPDVPLRDAMALAADRDTIAREYVSGFEVTFEMMAPRLMRARKALGSWPDAVTQAYLEVLAEVPDSLIARKLDMAAAREVSGAAARAVEAGGMHTADGRRAVAELDRGLRDPTNRRNPGTTADLTAAGLFVALTEWKEAL